MRKLLVSCVAAGSLLLGAAGATASQGVAAATTTESMHCDYTFANGICNMGSAPAACRASAIRLSSAAFPSV